MHNDHNKYFYKAICNMLCEANDLFTTEQLIFIKEWIEDIIKRKEHMEENEKTNRQAE